MSKENKRLYFYLALITAAALAVRLWGIAFGLPHKEARPDETTVIYMAILTLKNGLAPASLVYPTGYIYLLAFCYKIWGAFSGGTEGLVRQYAVNADVLFLISRGLSAVFGALTVLPVFRTAKNLFGLKVGYAAAVFAAFCVLLVRDSHFGTLDATAVFFIACSLDFSVSAYVRGKTLDYVLAGVFAGAAMGVKYIGMLMPVQLAVVHFLRMGRENRSFLSGIADRRPWFFALAMLAAFAVTTPYAFLDPGRLLADYRFHKTLHKISEGSTLAHHLIFSLRYALTLPVLFLSVAGAGLMLAKVPLRALALSGFFIAYLVVLNKVSSTFIRYVLPLLPVMCIYAGYAVSALSARIKNIRVFPGLLIAANGLPLLVCADWDYALSRTDTRVLSVEHAKSAIAPGSAVAVFASVYSHPQLSWDDAYLGSVSELFRGVDNPLKAEIYDQMRKNRSVWYKRVLYEDGIFKDAKGNFVMPDYIILARGAYEPVPDQKFSAALASKYVECGHVYSGLSGPSVVLEPSDAFYLPLKGSISHPGPEMIFYKLVSKS